MKKKTIITIVVLVGIAAAFFFILENNKKKNQEEVNIVAEKNNNVVVRTIEVGKEDIEGAFNVNGTFLAKTTSQISAELNGQVAAIYVQEGESVVSGQVLARLVGDKINVNVNNAKAALDNAVATLNRYKAAYETGGVTAVQLDQAKLQVDNARAQFESASLNSGDTQIKAKGSGIVNKKFVEEGAIVAPGTPILEVVDISTLKLKVEVDEALVSQLKIGDSVKVNPSVKNNSIPGKITFIAPASNGALKFPVEITIENQNYDLKAGMYGTATFNASGVDNVLTIPREAFVGSVSDNQVFVVNDNVASLTKIQAGVNYGDKVEVTKGLKEGDQVVTSGQINLSDNTPVKILK
ncbi:efflux RND transporter periplasmic adaptor subunit [Salegentibacter salegens]|uniref:RND family efflux transporter, MFP subunit n=1 Tax=Salegentibacter salegens TaxID=143223 RepID=A0A1M7KPW1_9FLAO|nr:efflux RND transporter periplasmic adaptor subunit [Salegentibacter salegens]PRX48853.1 RND family efflux transporter MFP subunit [Salegentibacter salegens]SHM67545.1 RND family efflux transporter, MFP subunit [Salegentibacter salegens]